jgi:hypothetical protein
VAVGLGAVFVPITVLEGLSIVDLDIGRLARLIADADTVVLDLTALAVIGLLFAHRGRVAWIPVIFAGALAILVALPLGYVMTNYGTLVRLRLMVAAPMWLLALSLAPAVLAPREPGTDAPEVRPA